MEVLQPELFTATLELAKQDAEPLPDLPPHCS
jgi:hypothetical protein